MSIAVNLANLANEVNSQGVLGATKIAGGGGGGGPKITSIVVTDSSYTTLDDTAVSLSGGYIKILGTGFASGCQVLINTVTATSVTFVSSTEVRAQVPAAVAGTYVVYLVNSDGGVAIRVNGLSFSSTPTWTTSSALSGALNSAISVQLAATGATTFALAAGSSLPSGIALSSGGLLSGTITNITTETTYNFTVVATDAEFQDSPQAFSLTISAGEAFFRFNTLLLSANGTNNQTNNTFIDSSSNNFTVTRLGNVTQGTFTPYGSTWSNFFDGSGDYLSTPTNAAFTFGTGDLTLECWIYQTATSVATYRVIFGDNVYGSAGGYTLYSYNNALNLWKGAGPPAIQVIAPAGTITLNTWTHVAWTRSGSSNRLFINGTQVGATTTDSTNYTSTASFIGASQSGTFPFSGYISNARIVKGTALYTANFTPPTQPLTAVAGTSLLTCADNRFIDDSSNNFTITRSGNTSVQRFSPFSPSISYSAATIGGSIYFDGSDSLNVPAIIPTSGDATVECWIYPADTQVYVGDAFIVGTTDNSAGTWAISFASNNTIGVWLDSYSGIKFSSTAINRTTWNHVALVKRSGVVYLFVNGVQQASTYSQAGTFGRNSTIHIGQYSAGGQNFTGYISSLRVVYDTAVYTANFTPPTTPLTAISNTKLLLSGTNAGIVDSAMQNNLETVGDVKISTTQSKFGGSSIFFDGTGDYLEVKPINGSFAFGIGNFTIEGWYYSLVSGGNYALVGKGPSDSDDEMLILLLGGQYYVDWGPTSGAYIQGGSWSANTWNHFALVRNGANLTLYHNGVAAISATNISATSFTDVHTLKIGVGRNGSFSFNGYMDDLRITKGYARYTDNFTPPISAHLTQ